MGGEALVDKMLADLRAKLLAAERWYVNADRPCHSVPGEHGGMTVLPGNVETWTIQFSYRPRAEGGG